ncbi:MAG: glycosyltransferase family 2 protein, partial [Nitrospinota bacterium]|nr:glycosyltransferase family 2 protein [Nitrospinota bacterium]
VLFFWHMVANKLLTLLFNMASNMNFTDMETCFKVMKTDVIRQITLQENRFGFDPELTAKVTRLNVPIYEVGISYHGRTYEEGKKIGLKDAFRAVYCILRYNFF